MPAPSEPLTNYSINLDSVEESIKYPRERAGIRKTRFIKSSIILYNIV
jgi:hypothetical protein